MSLKTGAAASKIGNLTIDIQGMLRRDHFNGLNNGDRPINTEDGNDIPPPIMLCYA